MEYLWELSLEYIDLVQEKDDRSTQEPARVDDRFEENKRLCHTILGRKIRRRRLG